jgi:putative FmdB family regulatory protein
MPIYEYSCQDCGTKFEKLVRQSTQPAELECPSCGKNHLQQELSTFSAHAAGPKSSGAPTCPSGGCTNPGMCGMNFN